MQGAAGQLASGPTTNDPTLSSRSVDLSDEFDGVLNRRDDHEERKRRKAVYKAAKADKLNELVNGAPPAGAGGAGGAGGAADPAASVASRDLQAREYVPVARDMSVDLWALSLDTDIFSVGM